jgi:hypothetical protein
MTCLLKCDVEPPESYTKWEDSCLEGIDMDDYYDHMENKVFHTVSEVFEFYSTIIPDEIWFEFSLFLAKVIDYNEDGPYQGII